MTLTPVETHNYRDGTIYVKRDDLYMIAGVAGGKARTCWFLAQGAVGLVTAASRVSPQTTTVAFIARHLGIPARIHTPTGIWSADLRASAKAGAEIIQHKAGYNSVICARAHEDALERGWTEIPFGMECAEAVKQTCGQVANFPVEVTRLVTAVGSGMSLAGILEGRRHYGLSFKVTGVWVGADPTRRLDLYAPENWRETVELLPSPMPYHSPYFRSLNNIVLDPLYEAKALIHARPDDLFWIVGVRESLLVRKEGGE